MRGQVAQLVEQGTENPRVGGSTPSLATIQSGRQHKIRPRRLKPGDVIGICSPAWCGPALFPQRFEKGISTLKACGYRVKVATNARNRRGYVSDTAERRIEDLHELFSDDEVAMVLTSIGGDHSNQLLDGIDYDLVRKHPKIVMGFSDVTILLLALWQRADLIGFHGPTLMTDFAEFPSISDYAMKSWLDVVSRPSPVLLSAPPFYTDEFVDWATSESQQRARKAVEMPGWSWLHEGLPSEGVLLGGCIEALEHLRGTPYWPQWDGAILMLESSTRGLGAGRLEATLTDYRMMGVFDRIQGLVLGRVAGSSTSDVAALHAVVREATRAYSFPVLVDVDLGHTTPMLTLPIGGRVRLGGGLFELLEPAVT